MKTKKIDWKKLWSEFDEEIDLLNTREECSKCRQVKFEYPEWDDQMRIIEELVESAIKCRDGKKRKKSK